GEHPLVVGVRHEPVERRVGAAGDELEVADLPRVELDLGQVGGADASDEVVAGGLVGKSLDEDSAVRGDAVLGVVVNRRGCGRGHVTFSIQISHGPEPATPKIVCPHSDALRGMLRVAGSWSTTTRRRAPSGISSSRSLVRTNVKGQTSPRRSRVSATAAHTA